MRYFTRNLCFLSRVIFDCIFAVIFPNMQLQLKTHSVKEDRILRFLRYTVFLFGGGQKDSNTDKNKPTRFYLSDIPKDILPEQVRNISTLQERIVSAVLSLLCLRRNLTLSPAYVIMKQRR